MTTYDVEVYADGPWWMVRIPGVGLTQAEYPSEVATQARSYIALSEDVSPGSFDMHVRYVET